MLQLINECFGSPEAIRTRLMGLIQKQFGVEVDVVVHPPSPSDRSETLQEKQFREQSESLGKLESEVYNHSALQSLRTRFGAEIISVVPTQAKTIN
ncbi:MAG: hypothetical protein HQL73_11280 [Magnetococcales bacterium]|nr:hypothetical protein [Magnetococcales bacterium]